MADFRFRSPKKFEPKILSSKFFCCSKNVGGVGFLINDTLGLTKVWRYGHFSDFLSLIDYLFGLYLYQYKCK